MLRPGKAHLKHSSISCSTSCHSLPGFNAYTFTWLIGLPFFLDDIITFSNHNRFSSLPPADTQTKLIVKNSSSILHCCRDPLNWPLIRFFLTYRALNPFLIVELRNSLSWQVARTSQNPAQGHDPSTHASCFQYISEKSHKRSYRMLFQYCHQSHRYWPTASLNFRFHVILSVPHSVVSLRPNTKRSPVLQIQSFSHTLEPRFSFLEAVRSSHFTCPRTPLTFIDSSSALSGRWDVDQYTHLELTMNCWNVELFNSSELMNHSKYSTICFRSFSFIVNNTNIKTTCIVSTTHAVQFWTFTKDLPKNSLFTIFSFSFRLNRCQSSKDIVCTFTITKWRSSSFTRYTNAPTNENPISSTSRSLPLSVPRYCCF